MSDQIDALLENFRNEALLSGYSRTTMPGRVARVRRFLHWHGGEPSQITRAVVVKYLLYLRTEPTIRKGTPRQNSTINSVIKALKQFCRWSLSTGYMYEDPTEDIKGLRERDAVRLAPHPKEVRMLLAIARSRPHVTEEQRKRDFLMILMCASIGLRIGELLGNEELPGVMLSDVVNSRGEIRETFVVHGKGSYDRPSNITPPVAEAICDYLRYRRALPGVGNLIVNVNGTRMGERNAEKLLRVIREKVGLTTQWHDLRRFGATELLLDGIDEQSLDELFGWRDMRTRKRYVRRAIQTVALRKQLEMDPARKLLSPVASISHTR